jgi:hypothetical protein
VRNYFVKVIGISKFNFDLTPPSTISFEEQTFNPTVAFDAATLTAEPPYTLVTRAILDTK